MRTMIFALFLFMTVVNCRHLFFGETWAGKTALINAICGTNEPVANPDSGQTSSTTKQVKRILCGDKEVVDSIGVFDYDEHSHLRLGTAEVQTTLLENAQTHGLSSVLFVWPSLQRKGNPELEGIFATLRQILPEVPMAIVDNQFPGYTSHIPDLYNRKFAIPVLAANLENITEVDGWMQEKHRVSKVTLPDNWREMVKKHDTEQLRRELLNATLMACGTVKEQLRAITTKMTTTKQPVEDCQCGDCTDCGQDCRRERTYCCGEIFGACISRCKETWIDDGCQRQVTHCHDRCSERTTECYSTCKGAHKEMLVQTREQLTQLNEAFRNISISNTDMLETCDRFQIGAAVKNEL